MDNPVKYPGYTHAAFIVDDMAKMSLGSTSMTFKITGGPVVYGQGRRLVCFFRDPDLNVVEVNEVLK